MRMKQAIMVSRFRADSLRNLTGDAADWGDLSLLRLLINSSSDANLRTPDGDTLLMGAIWNLRNEIVDYLISAGADGNLENGRHNCVEYAVRVNNAHAIRALHAAGVDVFARQHSWPTALDGANELGNLHARDALLELHRGTDVNKTNCASCK